MLGVGETILYIASFFGLYTGIFFLITLFENRHKLKNPELPKTLPKVTVIVPACNEEETLAKTVNSLLELDYPKLEIIVVDDGSKDRTLEIARGFESEGVLVLTKPNGGKGTALNLALEHATGEFVGCLDADSIVEPDALRKIIGHFNYKDVMAVTPSLKCSKPKTIWQKIQVIEFLLGVYLRKVFSFLGSIHVTPGPFTIFRKSFFDKYGGYDTTTCTEDIEISLRIQSKRYVIENAVDANVYAVAMPTFRTLYKQRLRWYRGFIENIVKYRHLFGRKFGNLGLFVLPSAFLSIFIAFVLVAYAGYTLISSMFQKLINVYSVDFDIWRLVSLEFDWFYIDQSAIRFIGLVALTLGIIAIILAKRLSKEKMPLAVYYLLFAVLYLPLYAYWWASAIYSNIRKTDVDWKGRRRQQEEIRYG